MDLEYWFRSADGVLDLSGSLSQWEHSLKRTDSLKGLHSEALTLLT